MIRVKPVYALAVAGVVLAGVSAWLLNEPSTAQPPLFKPASNPYASGIYANGMIESLQDQGADIALNPQVSGAISRIMVRVGQVVRAGQPLMQLDDAIQRATTEQLAAQVDNAAATLKNAQDQHTKVEQAFQIDPRAVSRDQLDTARNAEAIAATALKAAAKTRDTARVVLGKYVLRAPVDGVVLALTATQGSYASPQGAYDARTQAMLPVALVGTPQGRMEVRAYVDEILVPRLPAPGQMGAVMSVHGSTARIALRFERIQPYVSPKIELSDQRQERVDVRVLPVVFSFAKPVAMNIYPGQQVDIYIGAGK